MHEDGARHGVRAHRVDRLLDELVEHHTLHLPADVARLQARQLEQVVDQCAERMHVRRDPPEVLTPHRRAGDDVVVDRIDEQAQRGERRAQVVRDRRDQPAPRALLTRERRDHRVDVGAEAAARSAVKNAS